MMRGRASLWGAIATLFGVAIVGVLVSVHTLNVNAPLSGHPAAGLPSGVCPLSTNDLPVVAATRMEAKLVIFDVASASDPDFPFRATEFSSVPRLQSPNNMVQYFWIIVGEGNFHLEFPRPPQAGPTTGSFNYVLYYISADSCDMAGLYVVRGMRAWPPWFDSMQAITDTRVK